MKKITLNNRQREALTGYLFISLWLIGLLIFTVVPLFQAFYYSLNEAKFSGNKIETTWLGLQNFKYAFFEDARFPTMLVNYFSEIIIQVPFAITAALIIAMLLNQKIKLRSMWRVIFFLPVIISTGPVIYQLLSQGAMDISLLSSIGVRTFLNEYLPSFLSLPLTRLFEKLIIILWYSGIPILIFLAGLQKMNKSIYEAASIDGASPWQSFWKITLPSMKPFILVCVVYLIVTLSFSGLRNANGDIDIISYIQSQMIGTGGKGYGYACTIGIIYFLIILIQIGFYALILTPRKRRKRR